MTNLDNTERCSKCQGWGLLFLQQDGQYTSTSQAIYKKEKCWNCNGIGWIEKEELKK
jgi:DnaJ-class molecular chaperone